jgi:hypothetical protein
MRNIPMNLNLYGPKKGKEMSKRNINIKSIKAILPTIAMGGLLVLLGTTETLAQTEGVDRIITGVSNTILPNFKFGAAVISAVMGILLFIYGLVKPHLRLLGYGAGLAIIPYTLWDSVVGTVSTVLIP